MSDDFTRQWGTPGSQWVDSWMVGHLGIVCAVSEEELGWHNGQVHLSALIMWWNDFIVIVAIIVNIVIIVHNVRLVKYILYKAES